MRFTEMLSNALASIVAFLPNLLAALLILAVGLLIAVLLDRGVRRLLSSLDLPQRQFMHKLVRRESVLHRLPRILGRVVFWVVALITIGLAVDALALSWLSAGVARVMAYLPSVLAAAGILIGAYLVANIVYDKTARREEEISPEHRSPRFLSELLRIGIYVIAGFMALQELGIATTIVTSAFVICLGALAIAAAVAFGLGNRELAGRITRDWYDRRRNQSQGPSGPPPRGYVAERPSPMTEGPAAPVPQY